MSDRNWWRRSFVAVLSLTPWMILAPLVVAEQSTASTGAQVVDTWAGMSSSVGAGTGDEFRLAVASWSIPKVSCPSGTDSAVSNWAGSGDGTAANPLFQAGSESECRAGVARYRAWWEEYPVNRQQNFADRVHPGDVMDSFIRWDPAPQGGDGTASLELEDFSATGTKQWVEYRNVASAPPSDQAECIIERPLIGGGHEPLADFGSTRFTECKVGWEEGHKAQEHVYLTPNTAEWGLDAFTMEMPGLLKLSGFTATGGFTGTWVKGS
jgi:Peptidase A4 family